MTALIRADRRTGFRQLESRAVESWERQVVLLKHLAGDLVTHDPAFAGWWLVAEFNVPRRGKRIDAVLVADFGIVVIEFKIGEDRFTADALRQAEDYALDLDAFHKSSQGRLLIPLVVSTDAASEPRLPPALFDQRVQPAAACGAADLTRTVLVLRERFRERAVAAAAAAAAATDPAAWLGGVYAPTPTIIEAAQHLYARHSVSDIARFDGTTTNLTRTQAAVVRAVEDARGRRGKIACFVTGVPGAGKTLAGLNAAMALRDLGLAGQGVYLSGNGPLVTVLGEALAQDAARRTGKRIGDARRETGQFVQNVHRYLAAETPNPTPPAERVAIFDEAQRAWDAAKCDREGRGQQSEAAAMLRILDKHADWACFVGLVGCGQEIHDGEGGLGEWGRAIRDHFRHWEVRVSRALFADASSANGHALFDAEPDGIVLLADDALHLSVPTRNYRGPALAAWVEQLLAGDAEGARDSADELAQCPLVLTRSLDRLRRWLRENARGERRYGLLASAGGRRLRRFGIDVGSKVDVAPWFLHGRDDVRSSYALEQTATEFDVQGLELDWTGVCWDLDLRRTGLTWEPWAFKGSTWKRVRDAAAFRYAFNKYRVLLTRAREGMAIWVPPGDADDRTVPPPAYDAIAEYLIAAGARRLEE